MNRRKAWYGWLVLVGLLCMGMLQTGCDRNILGRKRTTKGGRPVDLTGSGSIGVYARMVRREGILLEDLAGLGLEHRAICVVTRVVPGGPGDQAGLKRGDWLLRAGTTRFINAESIVDLVRKSKPGSKINLIIRRDGQSKKIPVVVGYLNPEIHKRAVSPAGWR